MGVFFSALTRNQIISAVLTFLGLAGPVLALIRQPSVGWGSAQVIGPGIAGLALLAAFLVHERRTSDPMLPLGLVGPHLTSAPYVIVAHGGEITGYARTLGSRQLARRVMRGAAATISLSP